MDRFRLLVFTFAVGLAASCAATRSGPEDCGPNPWDSLRAEILAPSEPLEIGRAYEASFALRNASERKVIFCLAYGPSVGYLLPEGGMFPLRWDGQTMDGACAREVRLEPAELLGTDVEIATPELGIGQADLVVWYGVARVAHSRPTCEHSSQVTQRVSVSFVQPLEPRRDPPPARNWSAKPGELSGRHPTLRSGCRR